MKKIGRILLIFSTIQVLVSLGAIGEKAFGARSFGDVDQAYWAYESVEDMTERGIVKGYSDGTFRPEKVMSYGEFIKMATIMVDGKDRGNGKGTTWAEPYYEKGLEENLYTMFELSKAKLSWPIPRKDMALIISNLLGEKKIDDFDLLKKSISDISLNTSHEFEIVKAYAMGILKGYPDGTFKPEKNLSRGEATLCLFRLVQLKEKAKGEWEGKGAGQEKEAEEGKVEGKISEVILNREDFRKEEWLESEGYKQISPEEGELRIRVPWNGRLAGFDHNLVGFIYLVKDNKIVQYCRSIPAETFITSVSYHDLRTIDYIVCIPSKNGTQTYSILVKNPFKEER